MKLLFIELYGQRFDPPTNDADFIKWFDTNFDEMMEICDNHKEVSNDKEATKKNKVISALKTEQARNLLNNELYWLIKRYEGVEKANK